MRTHLSPPGPAVSPTRAAAVLTALAGALIAALVFAPGLLAARGRYSGLADRHNLTEDLRDAFTGYWRAGKQQYSPGLQRVVGYWIRYNAVKSVIAVLLLSVLAALGFLAWKAFLRGSGPGWVKRAALAAAGVLAVVLALSTLWTAVASIQGAAAPFASLLPVLVVGAAPRGALARAVGQIKQQLAHSAGGRVQARPALHGIVSDYVRFHVVHVIAAAPVALVFMGAGVVLWKGARKGSADRRARRVLRSFAISSVLLSLFFALVLAANVSTIQNPDPGLLAFFSGSW